MIKYQYVIINFINMKSKLVLVTMLFIGLNLVGQINPIVKYGNKVPAVYSGILPNSDGDLYFVSVKSRDTAWMKHPDILLTLKNIRVNPIGTDKGLFFDFNNANFYGTIYYGLYPKNNAKYPQPVYFHDGAKIIEGKSNVDISKLKGKYDIAGWEKTGKARVGYRIIDNHGNIIFDGVIGISGVGPFKVDLSIVEGPFVNDVSESSAVISFETNMPCTPYVEVNGVKYTDKTTEGLHHETVIDNLNPNSNYDYTVVYGSNRLKYNFSTSPKSGSRLPFTFAFTSDSRAGSGGGERDLYGVNSYIIKKMAFLAGYNNAAFFQFTGDMIKGYSPSVGQTNLEYAGWKNTVSPLWHYFPFYIGFGNHEALVNVFDNGSKYGISIDKFPFKSSSAEATFSSNFVNPKNGPISEDGAEYDPNKNKLDFPEYGETVYYYTYDNVAMVVLNSNYWYAPSTSMIPEIGGNPHGYVMDMQLDWFKKTIATLNKDSKIDNIFVTIHTPAFPNGGHANNDMWYNGNNKIRPTVAGSPVATGIVERRDELLDIMINKSDKVVALLCGDEHNYSRMKITNKTIMYPDGYRGSKLKISRPFWQITNGSSGAPYYGQEQLPWSNSVEKFSTQYSLMLFDVSGKKISLRVINPDTMEEIETVDLK